MCADGTFRLEEAASASESHEESEGEPTLRLVGGGNHKISSGGKITLPTRVGDDLCCVGVAGALCKTQDETLAMMLVLDTELVLFVSHDTTEDNHPTLVLTCARDRKIEEHVRRGDDDDLFNDIDELKYEGCEGAEGASHRWLYSPFCLPTEVPMRTSNSRPLPARYAF